MFTLEYKSSAKTTLGFLAMTEQMGITVIISIILPIASEFILMMNSGILEGLFQQRMTIFKSYLLD